MTIKRFIGVALLCALVLTTTTSSASVSAANDDPVLWWNHIEMMSDAGVNSQNYTSQQPLLYNDDAKDNEAADDFVVPRRTRWTVTGVQLTANRRADSYNVRVYADAASKPGAVVAERLNLQPWSYAAPWGDTRITLDQPIVLIQGTYWLSVQANDDGTLHGQWTWTNTHGAGLPAMWRQPGAGSGPTPCTDWGARAATCGLNGGDPNRSDQSFALRGTAARA